jgi:acetyl-CoA carboxylase carboxyltransferase component
MNSQFEQLVAQLEQFALEQHLEQPTQLAERVAERQALVEALQSADTSSLSSEQQAQLKERLNALVAADQALIVRAQEYLAETQRSLEQLACGRAVVRGYGEVLGAPAAGLRRIG